MHFTYILDIDINIVIFCKYCIDTVSKYTESKTDPRLTKLC